MSKPQPTTNTSLKKSKKNYKTRPIATKKPYKRRETYLNIATIRKMISHLATQTVLSEKELTETLGITIKNLKRLFGKRPPIGLIARVNLPLIRLYCKTQFKSAKTKTLY